jgi:hypothetical protein
VRRWHWWLRRRDGGHEGQSVVEKDGKAGGGDYCPREAGKAVLNRNVQAPRKWSGDEVGEVLWEVGCFCRSEEELRGAEKVQVAEVEWGLAGVCPAFGVVDDGVGV